MYLKCHLAIFFSIGVDKMNELNIPKQRKRKKDRLRRTNAFFLQIHEIVGNAEDSMEDELDLIHNTVLFEPWYRMSYRSTLK